MKKKILLGFILTSLFMSCGKDNSTEQVTPEALASGREDGRVNSAASQRVGTITPQDATGISRGTVQFQWANNNASVGWVSADPMTNERRIEILDAAFAKVLQPRDRADFQCAYDRAKADILANKRFPAGNPSYNYVRNCCPACAERLGDVGGARCDFQVNKGVF